MGKSVSITLTGVGTTGWKNLDWFQSPFAVEIDCTVTGSVTYSLELTNSDYLRTGVVVIAQPTAVVAATTSSRFALTSPARAWRVTITAGAGSITVEAMQAGL